MNLQSALNIQKTQFRKKGKEGEVKQPSLPSDVQDKLNMTRVSTTSGKVVRIGDMDLVNVVRLLAKLADD